VKEQRYDIVHFNQYHYIISHQLYNYQVILKNQEFGESTIASSITVRKDSGINSIQDLKNKTILFGGGRMAMQSYIATKWLLQEGGLNEGDYIEKIAINPPNAILSTYNRQADAAGSGDTVIRLDTVKKQIDVSQMRYLARTEQLPHLPWAVKDNMDEFTKSQIQQSLSALHKDPAGQSILNTAQLSALIVANDRDYDSHRKIVAAVYGEDYGISKFK
jgi:phosphonate transport system substrate-binding protein